MLLDLDPYAFCNTGFTAWSSEREPAQVFTLLESLYGCMDKVAKRLGVFKVETVGFGLCSAKVSGKLQISHLTSRLRFLPLITRDAHLSTYFRLVSQEDSNLVD